MGNKNQTVTTQGITVKIKTYGPNDYLCLTDIAKSRNPDHPDDLIRNWLRNRNTLELLGVWERLHNPQFNPVEFDGLIKHAGLNSFQLMAESAKLDKVIRKNLEGLGYGE